MCGITGFYSKNNIFPKNELREMTDALSHRGPNAEGYFEDTLVRIGHRRLSIIDLSENANQPMHSADGRYVIAYNGEVYNFHEIAQKYKLKLKTHCDTEVILEAFSTKGAEIVKELNGMFAICIYDKQENILHLFRDRIGIKPLFYFFDGENFAFTSEIKALQKLSFVRNKQQINQKSISSFLHLGFIPEPETVFNHILKFPAGHYGKFDGNDLNLKPYWKVENKFNYQLQTDFSTAKQQLKELLESSVKYRLVSDVPFGTFLSGGTDSSIVTAVAQKVAEKKINSYSIGFTDAKFDESAYARKVAEHIGTNHHEFTVTEKDAISLIDDMLNIYDEPFADTSALPTMLVSKLAKQHVSMTLSGDGGDELFMGYGAYKWAQRLNHPAIRTLRKPISKALSFGSSKYKRAAHLFEFEESHAPQSHIFSQEQYFFTTDEIRKLLRSEYTSPRIEVDLNGIERELNPEEKQALFDFKYYLKDDLLVKVDRASMHYSLETRVPLLDHRIVEFAMNLDSRLKINGGVQKYLLKQVLYDYVPQELFQRPKWGFSVPLCNWLKSDLKYLIDTHLSKASVEEAGIFNYSLVKKLKKQFFGGDDYLYHRIWVLIVCQSYFSTIQ